MKSVNDIYLATNARLVAAGVPTAVLADIDSIFHGPDAPPPAPAVRVTWNPIGKTLEQFQAFRAEVGLATPVYSAITGNELGSAGQDLGDGTGGAPPAPTDFGAGGRVDVTLKDTNPLVMPFTARAGSWWLECGEGASQSEFDWSITQNGEVVSSGNNSSSEAHPYSLADGDASLTLSLNTAALTPAIIADREAQGHGLAYGTFQQRQA